MATTEIPEIFRALLEYPFSVPILDDNGKNVSIAFCGCAILC